MAVLVANLAAAQSGWFTVPIGTNQNLYNFHSFLSYWIAGDGGTVLISVNGGTTWLDKSIPEIRDRLEVGGLGQTREALLLK